MSFISKRLYTVTLLGALASVSTLAAVTVKPVPWDPTNLTSPHTVIDNTPALLTATVDVGGSTDSFTYSWNFGDSSTPTTATAVHTSGCTGITVGCYLNLSVSHTYIASAGVLYTAVLTVTDTTASANYTGNYYIVVQQNSLTSRVDGAIDNGLWFLHTTMERGTTTNANGAIVSWGGWDGAIQGCQNSFDCLGYSGNDATDVEAFEVSGHLENGPVVDPYTDDVARGLARVISFLLPYSPTVNGPKTVGYNPALMAARCSDGSQPNYVTQTCSTGTYIQYNPGATSCTSPPCTFNYDGNANGQIIADNDTDPGYQSGMIVTMLVASGNPAGITKTGPLGSGGLPGILGQTYGTIVQDMIDAIGYCQYYGDDENTLGYDNGGGWEYGCAGTSSDASWYDDNSPSQWNAIAMIAASRGFGFTVPPIVKDTNQVWVTWSQDVSGTPGQFGYDEWNYQPWGPYAVTPSGLVQLAMDGIGRTAAGSADQRWNLTESFYRNNFCSTGTSPINNPKLYTYGLFSFTKAMEQHDPGGVLTPITTLANQPGSTNPIDWYAAEQSLGAPCDGVAQTLVARQTPVAGQGGYWYGNDYDSYQYYFETAWSILMLQKQSFTACVENLGGQGKAGGRGGKPLVSLSWTSINSASSYNIQRSNTNGGPYSTVGSTTIPAFTDQTSGLVNGGTYYYEVEPVNGNGGAICTSSQAAIVIP